MTPFIGCINDRAMPLLGERSMDPHIAKPRLHVFAICQPGLHRCTCRLQSYRMCARCMAPV